MQRLGVLGRFGAVRGIRHFGRAAGGGGDAQHGYQQQERSIGHRFLGGTDAWFTAREIVSHDRVTLDLGRVTKEPEEDVGKKVPR